MIKIFWTSFNISFSHNWLYQCLSFSDCFGLKFLFYIFASFLSFSSSHLYIPFLILNYNQIPLAIQASQSSPNWQKAPGRMTFKHFNILWYCCDLFCIRAARHKWFMLSLPNEITNGNGRWSADVPFCLILPHMCVDISPFSLLPFCGGGRSYL